MKQKWHDVFAYICVTDSEGVNLQDNKFFYFFLQIMSLHSDYLKILKNYKKKLISLNFSTWESWKNHIHSS